MKVAELWSRLFPADCLGCGTPGVPLCAQCCPPRAALSVRLESFEVLAAGPYEGVLRRAILAAKRGRRDVAEALARVLAQRCSPVLASDCVLVGVPTTRARARARGFDQAILLASCLERTSGCSALAALRARGTPQAGRTRDARLSQRGRFACVCPKLVRGCRVVLVDDVLTTGATLRDCAAVLARAGALVAGAVVVAQTPKRRSDEARRR